MKFSVLLVTSDDLLADAVRGVLGPKTAVSVVSSTREFSAATSAQESPFDVVLVDEQPPNSSCREVSHAMIELGDRECAVIALLDPSRQAELAPLVQKVELFSALTAPWDPLLLRLTVQRAAQFTRLRRDVIAAAGSASKSSPDPEFESRVLRAFV